MPTGVHLADARGLLFEAAERVLGRDGVSGLTSRAVTTEAGVAKGVLHRHFADFDAFVAELLLERADQLEERANRLRDVAGNGSIVAKLTGAMTLVFSPLAVAEVALVVTGDGLRARLRDAGAPRLPLLSAATALVDSYLTAEQDLGGIDPAADIGALSATLIGAVHLLFTDHESGSPDAGRLQRTVETVMGGAIATDRYTTRRPMRSDHPSA
ncbi:MAG: TetR/AcrR family transcriptional regulator [Acidimicrobiales bacterium]